MVTEEQKIDPQHGQTRSVLRVVGPIVLVFGLGLLVLGAIRMLGPAPAKPARPDLFRDGFEAVRQFNEEDFDSETSRRLGGFGMTAGGMVLTFIGLVMTNAGYMGKVARYAAAEIAPVGKDTFNYVAGGTKEGVREVATSISAGIAEGLGHTEAPPGVACPHCRHANEAGANFCAKCGQPMALACPACGAKVETEARFCSKCGRALA